LQQDASDSLLSEGSTTQRILSKHWAYQAVWPLIQPILFWKGDTSNIAKLKEEKGKKDKKKEDQEGDD
jgi:hypothetical protein